MELCLGGTHCVSCALTFGQELSLGFFPCDVGTWMPPKVVSVETAGAQNRE